jgi:hypothetical protein
MTRPGASIQRVFRGLLCAAHDPEKHVLDLIGDGNRFSGKIMRKK